MSKFNLALATPSSGQCKSQFAFSLAQLVMHFNHVPIYPDIQEQSMQFYLMEGTGVASNRENIVEAVLKTDATHILFIDDDMGFNPDVLHILASRRLPIVGCNYRLRTPPARFMAWRDGTGIIETTAEKSGLEEVTYLGFGFCLIERKVFEEVNVPRFLQSFVDGHYTTEDSQFFRKVKYPVYLDHDASKKIFHIGTMYYVWDDDHTKLYKSLKSTH